MNCYKGKEGKASNLFTLAQSSPIFGWGHTECVKLIKEARLIK